jgi:phosphoribosylanthranilate isomerase
MSESARTRVKICGITRVEDGTAAAALGADAIGLNFYPPSPRYVDLETAAAIRRALPPFVTAVGLFVNATQETVEEGIEKVGLDMLQFHGDESPEDCEGFGMPYLKAVRVDGAVDLRAQCQRYGGQRYAQAAGLILDTPDEKLWGGTGATFDWDLVPADLPLPLLLAGGLTPENVAEAVRRLRPYAVDVSGGVESSPGVKDAERIARFIDEVDRVAIAERTG